MTLEEAKKILKKEIFGIRFKKFDKPLKFEEMLWIRNEKPEVLEALHIVAKNGIGVSVPETTLRIRRLIIKKMKAGEGEPAPVSGTPLSAAEGMKLRWKDNKNTDKNPALEESASQFNDALLNEQAKKIAELTKEKANLEDQITVLNACKKHNDKIDRKQIKCLGKEIARLNKIIHKKNLKNEELRKELDVAKKQNTAVMVDMTAKCFRAERESINDGFESYAAKYAKNTLDELKEKAYNSFNAKACNLGLVGSKDGNGIIDQMIGVDIAEEGGDHSAIIAQCCKNIAISKDEAEIIERCTKNGTELHYSEKDGFTYTNMYGEEMPIKCLRGLFHVFTDEELKK